MSTRYPGGYITKSPPVPGGSLSTSTATGFWTLDQQMFYKVQSLWPDATNVPASTYSIALRGGGGTTSYERYFRNTNNDTFITMRTVYGSNNRKLYEINDSGTATVQVQYTGGTHSYSEWGAAYYNRTHNVMYFPYTESGTTGSGRVTGPFTTSSTHMRGYNTSGSRYGISGAYNIGTPGGADEQIATCAFYDFGGGANTSAAIIASQSPSNSNYYIYRINPASSDRDYPYTGLPSAYTNILNYTTIDNYPAQYAKSVWFMTKEANAGYSAIAGRTAATTNGYINNVYCEPHHTRWFLQWGNSDNNTTSLYSFDYNALVKDQLVLKDTSVSNLAVPIISYASHQNDTNLVNMLIKDPDTSAPRTYYYVSWYKSDNNNSNSGGSGNTGGTWNYGSSAKKLVFDSAYCDNGSYGSPGVSYTQGTDPRVLFTATIGYGGVDMLLVLPTDPSLLADGTYTGVVTISSGASVNSRVNGFKNQSLGTTWNTRSVSISLLSSTRSTTSGSASNLSENPTLTNKTFIG